MDTDSKTVRKLPAQNSRVETGPIQFGEDWPGLFIRGDNAAYYSLALGEILRVSAESGDAISWVTVRSLQALLASTRVAPAPKREHVGASDGQSRPTVYIAGPDLFDRRTWAAHVARVRAACNEVGLTPVFPVPMPDAPMTGTGITTLGTFDEARAIYRACLAKIAQCDLVLANLSPFRGDEPDAGTVFEVATAKALGKCVAAYVHSERPQPVSVDVDGAHLDPQGCVIERFGMPINLMAACGVDVLICEPEDTAVETALRALRGLWLDEQIEMARRFL
ncbi:MAG: nucleoside 2-deoxyribosyltransferase [Acidiferrobacterales bacterium]